MTAGQLNAYEALIAFTRARQAEFGFTQPQLWLLRNLSGNGLSPDGHGMTVPELEQAMSWRGGPSSPCSAVMTEGPMLYDRAGGRAAPGRMINGCYDRVEKDDLLSGLFPAG
jgi:hypothetical protein